MAAGRGGWEKQKNTPFPAKRYLKPLPFPAELQWKPPALPCPNVI